VSPSPVRLRLDLAYDGTDFSGWARQPGRRTVEATVATALATVLRLEATPTLTVAGRTDAGVHASGQVAHLELPAEVDVVDLHRRLAGVLPDDVAVQAVRVVPAEFDARFAALARHYRYRICDGAPDPLRRLDTLHWPRPLDAAAMNSAAAMLVGEHDFAAYCKPRAGASTVRRLQRLAVSRGAVIVVEASADAFCHNQVRSMVGALLAVGDGRRPTAWPRAVLDARQRDSAVTVAPAHGLTLVAVDYPADDRLAERVATTRRRRDELP
jgi:tRNA pseudouridine38-40 synthase